MKLCVLGNRELVDLFLAQPNVPDNINQRGEFEMYSGPPLMFLTFGKLNDGSLEIAQKLIKHGADISAVSGEKSILCSLIERCSFHLQSRQICEDLVELFIRNGLQVNFDETANILHTALQKDLYRTVEQLLPLCGHSKPWIVKEKTLLHFVW